MDKSCLVFVPGLLCTPTLFAPQIDALSKRLSIHVADHTRHDTITKIAGDILLKAPQRFALCGLSMGGYIAFEIMRQAPERVSKLAVLDTLAAPDTPERSEGRHALIRLARLQGLDAVMDKLLPLFIHAARLADAPLVEIVRNMTRDTGFDAFARQQAAIIARPDSRGSLPSIACPTLVLVGRQDALTPVAAHEEIARLIPNSRLVVVEDCGHLSTLERPAAVSAELMRWLA